MPINATGLVPAVEEQISKDLGIKVHIEKLIFRFGPSLKVKAPIMHLLYEDGQKFGQFNDIKIFIPWSALFTHDVTINRIHAANFIIKLNSQDKYLPPLLEKLQQKDFKEIPDLYLKNYTFLYNDKNEGINYPTPEQALENLKAEGYKNY